jgi:hypothetical protein
MGPCFLGGSSNRSCSRSATGPDGRCDEKVEVDTPTERAFVGFVAGELQRPFEVVDDGPECTVHVIGEHWKRNACTPCVSRRWRRRSRYGSCRPRAHRTAAPTELRRPSFACDQRRGSTRSSLVSSPAKKSKTSCSGRIAPSPADLEHNVRMRDMTVLARLEPRVQWSGLSTANSSGWPL